MTGGATHGPREVAIATTIDDRWVPHFATCAASIAASRGRESVRFFMLQGPSLSETSIRTLRAFVRDLGMEFEAIAIPREVDDSLPPTSQLFSPLVWYRLLLPDLLPELDRVLFLDADTLVLQSLSPLYESELGENLLAAVGVMTTEEHLRLLGLDSAQPVFNAGVLLMSLDAMRAELIGPRTLALGHERSADFFFNDQDALTVIADGRWKRLHPRWNALSHLWLLPRNYDHTYSELDQSSARLSPAIVHFEGFETVKPWFYRSMHPLRFLYRDFRAQTPWPLDQLERKSAGGAILRRLPVSWQYGLMVAKRRIVNRLARG